MKDEIGEGMVLSTLILCIFLLIILNLGTPDILDGIIKILNK